MNVFFIISSLTEMFYICYNCCCNRCQAPYKCLNYYLKPQVHLINISLETKMLLTCILNGKMCTAKFFLLKKNLQNDGMVKSFISPKMSISLPMIWYINGGGRLNLFMAYRQTFLPLDRFRCESKSNSIFFGGGRFVNLRSTWPWPNGTCILTSEVYQLPLQSHCCCCHLFPHPGLEWQPK